MNLNSDKKRILVFSDPHLHISKLNHILKNENYDEVVCLGDWFDSFYYKHEQYLENTCEFLKEWLFKKNFYTCIGNHDIHYLYDNKHAISSGFEKYKSDFIKKCFGDRLLDIRKKFLWYIWIDDYLCSHAGVHSHHFDSNLKVSKRNITSWLNKEIQKGEIALLSGDKYWLYCAGLARYGNEVIGGITWLDYDEEFKPIEGLKQIVGHTFHSGVTKYSYWVDRERITTDDMCIDCNLNQYLIIENNKLEIKNYSGL